MKKMNALRKMKAICLSISFLTVFLANASTTEIPVLNLSSVVNDPVTMQMENFRDGGEGVAYHDAEPANIGGAYRPAEGVDLYDLGGGNYTVGYTSIGEWLEYSINAPVTGTYNFEFTVASITDFGFYIDYPGGSTTPITVPNTGGWGNYQTISLNIDLWAGTQNIRFVVSAGNPAGNLDKAIIKLTSISDKPITTLSSTIGVPVTMEMENYRDDGGEGVAYHDLDPANQGLAYRKNQGVDISDIGGGNYCVSYVYADEWVEYKINVPVSGTYSFDFSVSAPSDISFNVGYAGGTSQTITVPNTGGWTNWQTGTMNLKLWKGLQVIRFNVVAGGNLDKAIIKLVSDLTTTLPSVVGQSVTMQMEDYRDGGEGVAYHDNVAGNQGQGYRSDDVDVSQLNATEYCVSYVDAGEWLEYSINVPVAGLYNLDFYVAFPSNNISFNVGYAGNTSQTITVPNTGGYTNWQVGSLQINLVAGVQNIRLNVVEGGNLDKAIITLNAIVPDAPTAIVATAGNAQASIAFAAPASNGGSAIIDYTVTSNPGGLTATGATSPLTVTGLTNGTAYTFTVTARNSIGSSAASSASNSVTPHATNNNIAVSGATNISALTLTPVSDVVVAKDALLTINQTATISSLTVAAGGQVTNSNTLNAGTLTLNSNETDGTATYIDNGTSNITTTIANQYLGTTRNWYVSSPVVSTASSTTNIDKYFEYIEAGNNSSYASQPSGSSLFWKGYTPGATFMEAGKGYIALPTNTAASLQFSGTLNNGNISIPLTKTGNGFNLIGNPYPSHLTWTQAFVNAVTAPAGGTAPATLIEPTVWIRTNSGSSNSTGWSFTTYNALVGETVPSWADVVIAPMQAFWVKAKVAGTLILTSDLTKSHSASNRLKAPAVKNTDRQRVRLQVSNGTTTDEALVYFDAAAANTYDDYDSPKKFINIASKPEIFTLADTEKLVINGLNSIQYDTEMPVGFVTAEAGNFSISRTEMTNFESGTRIVLKDKLNPTTEFELAEGTTYNFSADITAASTDRFSVIFRAPGAITDTINPENEHVSVFVNAQNQLVINANAGIKYAVYNAVGQKIANGALNYKLQTINYKLKNGVYVLKVGNQSTRVVIK